MSKQSTKRARLAISTPDLHRLLGLPEGVEIVDVKRHPDLDAVLVEVRGDVLPEVNVWVEPRIVLIETVSDVADGCFATFDRHKLTSTPT